MTREEHNARYGASRQPPDPVHCHTLGYGELSQYDPDCTSCWLGHRHTWEKHDRSIQAARRERLRLVIEAARRVPDLFELHELEKAFGELLRMGPR